MTEERTKLRRRDVSVLKNYKRSVERIRLIGLKFNLSETEINLAMDRCMKSLVAERSKTNSIKEEAREKLFNWIRYFISLLKRVFIFCIMFLVIILVLYIVLQHKPIQYFIQSNLQDFIYPGMKILRKLFLPIISLYPSLTNFYDESCLIINPFFRVPDMPCPCEDVRAILNLTGEDTSREQYHSGIPFVVKIEREEVSWDKLKALYQNNSSIFDHDAPYLLMSSPTDQSTRSMPSILFNVDWNENENSREHVHIQWRCNRMEPARLLRSIFGAPVHEPNYAAGVTIEKIVLVDGPKAGLYQMPTTDGTTVFIHQSSGSRMIVLTPANECQERCTTVSIDLPSGHILWFSWWYWRASSLPTPGATSISIAYVGSYL